LEQLKEEKITFLVHLREKPPLETVPRVGLSVRW
jgi:hypothetical protein